MKLKSILTVGLALALAGSVCIHTNVKENIKANEATTVGKFHETYQAIDSKGNENTYYHFKSNDNEVCWALTEERWDLCPTEIQNTHLHTTTMEPQRKTSLVTARSYVNVKYMMMNLYP